MIEKNDNCKGRRGERVRRGRQKTGGRKNGLIGALGISQREDEGGRKKGGISRPIRRAPREIRDGGRQSEGKGARGMRKIGEIGDLGEV